MLLKVGVIICLSILLGLYRKVQSVCLSVKWQAEDQKQQVSDIKVCIISAFFKLYMSGLLILFKLI